MNTNSSTKKSLKASGLALFICIAMLIGTTFAWFTDSITNSGNIIQSGSLDIGAMAYDTGAGGVSVKIDGVNDGQAITFEKTGQDLKTNKDPIINDSLFEPGKSNAKLLQITNKGTLAAKIKLDFAVEDGGLQNALWFDFVQIKDGNVVGQFTKRPMSELDTIGDKIELPLAANESLQFALVYGMKEEAGNEYQGDSFTADVTINAIQLNSEKDGFGNPDYDKDANPEAVFGGEAVKDAMNNPDVKKVVLGEDFDMNQKEYQQSNGNATFYVADGKTLDLNGKEVIRPDSGSGSGLAVQTGDTAVIEDGKIFTQGDMTAVDIAEGATVSFKNINFEGHGSDFLKVRAKSGTDTTVIFENCTFKNAPVNIGGRDGVTNVDVKFENCTFEGTYKMYDAEGNALTDPHGYIHYTDTFITVANYVKGNITLDNCKMDFDASESKSKKNVIGGSFGLGCNQGEDINLNLNNVTITGKNVVPVKIDNRYDETVKVNETGTNTYTVDGQAVNYDGTGK